MAYICFIGAIFLVAVDSGASMGSYTVKQITFGDNDCEFVTVSSSGEVIWTERVNGYLQVFSLSEGQLTADEWDHLTPDINSQGEIVYLRKKRGELPEVYSNMRGVIARGEVSMPRINNEGEIIWKERRGNIEVFSSSVRGEVILRPSRGADIKDSGEIVYFGTTADNEAELFSSRKGRISSGFRGRNPRVNNPGEIAWEKEIKVGQKTYKQIFSNTAGGITDFYEDGRINIGSMDDRGVVYFTRLVNGHFQVFQALPKDVEADIDDMIARDSADIPAESYKTPDEELFRKLDDLKEDDIGEDALLIAEPKEGTFVTGPVAITVYSYEEVKLSHCYLQIDGKYLGWDEEPPFEFIWDSKYWPDGEHTITVVGHFDTEENPTRVASSVVSSSNGSVRRPGISILSPADGDTVRGIVRVRTDATGDNFSYVYSELDVGFKDWDNTPPYEFSIDTTDMPNGKHTLKVYGWHKHGGESVEDAISFFVNN